MSATTHPYGSAAWGPAVHEVLSAHSCRFVRLDHSTRGWTENDYPRSELDEVDHTQPEAGVLLDAFTASAIDQVYRAISAKLRIKMERFDLLQAANVAFKVIERSREPRSET